LKRILIVDNDEPARTALAALLRDEGYEIDEATTEIEAMQLVERRIPDLVVSDLCAPDCFCVGLLHWIKEHHPHLDVIIVTAFGSIDCVVKTIKMGALNYVMKPVNNGKFLEIVREALHRREGGMKSLRRVNEPYCYLVDEVVGVSRSMEQVLKTALRVTDVDSGILIRGESGTGKELIARILHNRSTHRRNREFVAINCAAIPGEILESELFGSVRGAFTGATQTRKGLIEVADGGTLFMDEIGDTSPQFQSKLLRVIQEKEIRRVGDTASRSVDVRIVAATNRDLKKMIGEGTFREDLYYRLSVIDIIVPPLRETSSPSWTTFSRTSTAGSAPGSRESPRRPWRSSWPTPGPETSGSCGTAWRGPLCCRATRCSSPRTSRWPSSTTSGSRRRTGTMRSSP